MKKVFIFALLLSLFACSHVDPSFTDQITVYTDAPVRKSPLQVAVHPKDKQPKPLTAYFHPFAIQQHTNEYAHLSNAFAMEFHHAWTQERLFPIQELQPGTRYQGLDHALRTARNRGADLLILGQVPYFYAGGTLDDTAITIRINIYATGNGDLLWTMVQSGRVEDRRPQDYVYFRHENRLPTGPFSKLIRAMAFDMAIPLKAWLPAPNSTYAFASTTREMEASLDPRPAPMERNLTSEETTERPLPTGGVNLDILFDYDKATIQEDSYPLLDALAEALKSPELQGRKIIVAGHTDAQGSQAYNLALSEKRASAIKDYLTKKWGITPESIETTGYGKSQPLADGSSADDMQRNRRVEIRLAE